MICCWFFVFVFVCVHDDIKTTLVNPAQRALDWTEEELRGNMRSTPRLLAVKMDYYRCSSTGTNVIVHLRVVYEYTAGQSDVSSNLDANHSQHGGQDNPTLWGYLSQTLVWTTVLQNVNRAWNMMLLYASLLGTGTVQQQNNMIDLLVQEALGGGTTKT